MLLKYDKMPLINGIKNYLDENNARFHTPGHKQGLGIDPLVRDFLSENLFNCDLTEVEGLDNLHNPIDIIRKAEELSAQTFGANRTFFLINGSTAGIVASMLALLGPDEEIILPRNVHTSVINGLVLCGAIPNFIFPKFHKEYGIFLGITAEQVREAFAKYPKAKAILLINPSYYGITSELQDIIKLAKQLDKIVIVDEAHGAHFSFHEELPPGGLEADADVVIQSTHKTLTSLTQTSLLHLKSSKVKFAKIQAALRMIQTTSPSYVLMSSLDAMCNQMATSGKSLIERALANSKSLRDNLKELRGFEIVANSQLPAGFKLDPTRLVVNVQRLGLTGYEAESLLRDYGVQIEMADYFNVVALITLADNAATIERLEEALRRLVREKNVGDIKQSQDMLKELVDILPSLELRQALTPREVWFSEKEKVPLAESVGRILGGQILSYPPGIPIATFGEIISKELVDYLKIHLKLGGKVEGVYNEQPYFVKVASEL